MLSPTAYALLSSSSISDLSLRFFLLLLSRYDLRGFRAIDPRILEQELGMKPKTITFYMKELLKLKLLESGPVTTHPRGDRAGIPSYRVNPEWWMTRNQAEEGDRILERESLLDIFKGGPSAISRIGTNTAPLPDPSAPSPPLAQPSATDTPSSLNTHDRNSADSLDLARESSETSAPNSSL